MIILYYIIGIGIRRPLQSRASSVLGLQKQTIGHPTYQLIKIAKPNHANQPTSGQTGATSSMCHFYLLGQTPLGTGLGQGMRQICLAIQQIFVSPFTHLNTLNSYAWHSYEQLRKSKIQQTCPTSPKIIYLVTLKPHF